MTAFPQSITRMQAFGADGSPDGPTIPVRLLSAPARRAGLFGDDLMVAARRDQWPPPGADLSDDARWALTFGDENDPVTLDGYVLRSVDALTVGAAPGAGAASIQEVRLRFATWPGLMREGRGGTIRAGVLNPVDRDGAVIDDPQMKLNGELVIIALQAMGASWIFEPEEDLGGPGPVGPLDWSNASAIHELEALLARLGHMASLSNDGLTVRIGPLPRDGQAPQIPLALAPFAEPYEFFQGASAVGRRVIVSSGDTRAVVVRSRTLADMEWVWRDEEAGVWRSSAETTDGVQPDDIDAFRAGPGAEREDRRQYARLFSALRFTGDDAQRVRRLVAVPREVEDVDGFRFGGRAVAVAARYARDDGEQMRDEPALDADPLIPLGSVAADADAGVIILPADLWFVRVGDGPDPAGSHETARALHDGDLVALFAHESNTGVWSLDHYAVAFELEADGSVTKVAGEAITPIADDPSTIHLRMPQLRKVNRPDAAGTGFVTLNAEELDAVAFELARARLARETTMSGVVELRGLWDVEPGTWGGAVSSVTWDVAARRTIVSLNEHAVPDSVMQELEARAGRSFAAGLARYRLPGAWAGQGDAGAGPTGIRFSGSADLDAPSRSADRGRDAQRGAARVLIGPSSQAPPPRLDWWWARITGATEIGANRWRYTWRRVVIGDDGGVRDAAMTDADRGAAYNLAEMANTGAGVEGNGVDRANLPDGWAMQPIGERIVRMRGPFASDASLYCVFDVINADDGPCGEGS